MVSVIIVDDDLDIIDVTSEHLENNGIEIAGVGYDGKDAEILYEKLRPDVVLLDMKMPNFDGQYAIDKIKKLDSNAKIIVITGFVDNYKFEKNQVSYILRKPYETDELLKAVTSVGRWISIPATTIVFDENLEKKLRVLQAKLIQSSNKGISFSAVVNLVIKEGLKKNKRW